MDWNPVKLLWAVYFLGAFSGNSPPNFLRTLHRSLHPTARVGTLNTEAQVVADLQDQCEELLQHLRLPHRPLDLPELASTPVTRIRAERSTNEGTREHGFARS